MITGHFSALDVLVVVPPVLAAVHLLLPYVFGVRPALFTRRGVVFIAMWAVTWGFALALSHLDEALNDELGVGRSSLVDSGFFTTVTTVAVTLAVVGAAVRVVGACRRHVRLRPVAAGELPVLRELAVAANRLGARSDELDWAASSLDDAQAVLRDGHGVEALRQLHAAAQALAVVGDGSEAGRRAVQVRDRLLAAGRQEKLFRPSGRDYQLRGVNT
ncbi:hypothetical protein [Streptomyces sp. NPDC059949]|uniref:hypothetical protein n=1 Tax=Streptomyces sp. NPDC059949 TaxID=3347013 RepID=UPI00366983D0